MSRGDIVDERVLAEMLREGRLAGVGLDVTEQEPLPELSALWGVPNLMLSPHISLASRQKEDVLWAILRDNLRRFIAGEALASQVDKRLGY